jgi:hypothetical protein
MNSCCSEVVTSMCRTAASQEVDAIITMVALAKYDPKMENVCPMFKSSEHSSEQGKSPPSQCTYCDVATSAA